MKDYQSDTEFITRNGTTVKTQIQDKLDRDSVLLGFTVSKVDTVGKKCIDLVTRPDYPGGLHLSYFAKTEKIEHTSFKRFYIYFILPSPILYIVCFFFVLILLLHDKCQALTVRLTIFRSCAILVFYVDYILFFNTVCQNSCSGHGYCDAFSKRCVCEPFWMPNYAKVTWNGESNCG